MKKEKGQRNNKQGRYITINRLPDHTFNAIAERAKAEKRSISAQAAYLLELALAQPQ